MYSVKRPQMRVTLDLRRLSLERFLGELRRIRSDEARFDTRLRQLIDGWLEEFELHRRTA